MQRLTIEEYLRIDAESASGLKNLAESPFYYQYRKTQEKETDAMVQGSAVHAAVFEPELYRRLYRVWKERRAGKKWKAYLAAATANGKTVLTSTQRANVDGMAASVRAHPIASEILKVGIAEQTITWEHPERGRKCRAKLDWLTASHVLVDLKSSHDIRPRKFMNTAADLLYHLQLAWYYDGVARVTMRRPRAVKIIAVESKKPYRVAVYDVPEFVLDYGRWRYEQLLDLLDECEASGKWPDIGAKELTMTLPAWATNEDEDIAITSGGKPLF